MMELSISPTDSRSRLAIRNIACSLLMRAGSVAVSFLLVPLTIGYIDDYSYGVWLTIFSLTTWISNLDLGLGAGLRNRLAEALAEDNLPLARIYIATALFLMAVIMTCVFGLAAIACRFVDWYGLLNVDPTRVAALPELILTVTGIFCGGFVFRTIGSVYYAMQLPAVNELLVLAGNLLSILAVWGMTLLIPGSLEKVAIAMVLIPAAVYLIAFPLTFRRFSHIAPRLSDISLRYIRPLVGLGIKFMTTQISFLVVCLASTIIVSHLFGPEEVTVFSVSFKYFYVLTVASGIVMTPVWSAVTDAKSRGDREWIALTIRRLLLLWSLMLVCAGVMTIIAPWFYRLWIGPDISIPSSLSFWWALYVATGALGSIYLNVINGYGRIFIHSVVSCAVIIGFVPFAMWLGTIYGSTGVVIAMCLTGVVDLLWAPFQAHRLLSGKARGIWLR